LWIGNYSLFAAGYFYFQSSIQKQKDLLKATEEKAAKEKEPQSWRTKHSAHKSIHIFYSTP
jgi:hypothetical protein